MVTIRLATLGDASELAEIYVPFVANKPTSFEEVTPSAADMAARVRETLASYPYLVASEQGGVLGFAYASAHRTRASYRFSVDVSVYVRDTAQRRGLGRALYTSLFELLQWQGYCAAHAGITLPNVASVRLHEVCGFRSIGVYPQVGFKLGAWHDVGWWQRELCERNGSPAEPRALAELPRDAPFEARLLAGTRWLQGERGAR